MIVALLRKILAELCLEKALLIYPKGAEKDSLARCLRTHYSSVSSLLENKQAKKCFTFHGCSFYKTDKCNDSCGIYPPIHEQAKKKDV